MVLIQSLVISVFSSLILYTKCQEENDSIDSKLISLPLTPSNFQLQIHEKSPLNNYARRFLDDQINIANLGIRLLQSDGDFDSYSGNSNININSNRNLNLPWNSPSRNRFHQKSRNRAASRLQDMQQQQFQQILQMMMPEGSRSNRNFDPTQSNNDQLLSNYGNFRRYNEIRKPTFDKNCHNVEDDRKFQDVYSKNMYLTFSQRIKSIQRELEYIEDEFIQCCSRLYENVT